MGSIWSAEPLESRRLCASIWSPYVAESEPNASPRTADALPTAYDGVTRFSGVLKNNKDADTFRFSAWQSGRVKLNVTQSGQSDADVFVFRSDGKRLTHTTTTGYFHADRGQTYFLKVFDTGNTVARYGVLLKQSGIAVTDARRQRLSHGINVDSWFWNLSGPNDPYTTFASYFTDRDAKLVKSSGFTYVRLPVDVKYFVDWTKPSQLNADAMGALDKAVRMLIDNGLAVLISPFGDYNDRVIWPGEQQNVLAFATAWAKHFSQFDPERLFLQTANEPAGHPGDWIPVQTNIVRAMRRAAPLHTIVTATTLRASAVPGDFGTIQAMTTAVPLPDPNVVYGFHYYGPYIFTAQTAEWAWPGYGYLRYVPYPSSPEGVAWLVSALDSEITNSIQRDVIPSLKKYGDDYWNRDKLAGQIKVVKDWANYYKVPVVMDEFGAMSNPRINKADRDRWITDARSIAEDYGFGWAMWNYAGDYALTDGDVNTRTMKQDVLTALGLND